MLDDQTPHIQLSRHNSAEAAGDGHRAGWTELRAALSGLAFRPHAFDRHRNELHAAMNAIVRTGRTERRPVESLIIQLKETCADPTLAPAHRIHRAWLTAHLVEYCIRRYFDDAT